MLEGWVAWKLTDYVNTYVFKPMGSHGQASALLMNSPEAGKYVKGPINDLVRKGTNEGFDAAERILGNPSLGIIH
jgi:hypothetical protein